MARGDQSPGESSTGPIHSTEQLYGITANISTVASASIGRVQIFSATNLNDTGSVTATTTSNFLSGGTLSTGSGALYAPGPVSNFTVDPQGVLDNGHLQLFMEEGFQDNFNTPYSTSSSGAAPYGNYTITSFTGGTAPTWSNSATYYVSAPYSGEYLQTGSSGLVYNTDTISGSAGAGMPAVLISFDLLISGTSASFFIDGVSGASTYTVMDLTFQSGAITVSNSATIYAHTSATYKNNVWYWFVITDNTTSNSYSIYKNSTNGYLEPIISNFPNYNNLAITNIYIEDNGTTATFYMDNLEIGRSPYNGSYVSGITQAAGYLTGVRVFNNSTEFPGTNLKIEVSRNGGQNWSQPLTNGSFYAFTNGEPNGNRLRYRVLLDTDGVLTPYLYDVHIQYFYTLPKVTITGVNANDQFGYSVSSGGDMDKDSGMDLAVGAPGARSAGVPTGQAYVFYGTGWTSGSTYTSASANVVYDGQNSGDDFGYSVYAGSFNTSAPYPPTQLLVGAPLWSNGCASSGTNCGRVYLFGSSPPTMEVQLGYTASPHAITFATAQVEVAQQGFQNLALTMSTTTIPIGATLYLNITNLQSSTSMWGSPILVVWVNSASYSVASFYYCGYYLHAP